MAREFQAAGMMSEQHCPGCTCFTTTDQCDHCYCQGWQWQSSTAPPPRSCCKCGDKRSIDYNLTITYS